MAGTISEILPTRSHELDVNGKGRGFREFFADVLPDAVPDADNFAEVFVWPGPGILPHDSLRIEPHPDGKSSRIVSTFSNDKTFRFPSRLDATDPEFGSLTITYETRRHKIPQAQYTKDAVKASAPDPDDPQSGKHIIRTQSTWLPSEIERPAHHMILQKRIVFTNFQLSEAIAIRRQVGHVHELPILDAVKLYGRFSAGDIVETEPARWETVYSWDIDPGNQNPVEQGVTFAGKVHTFIYFGEPDDVPPPPNLNGAIAYPGGFGGLLPADDFIYSRPPFCEVTMIADTRIDVNGEPTPPSFDYIFDGVLDFSGWQELPGEPF